VTVYVGIDGGGSSLRVVVVDAALNVLAETRRGTANPNTTGHDTAAALIQDAIREALILAGKNRVDVAGAGIGIAGASNVHSADWLREVVSAALPGAHSVPSSDNEIALVGAQGERYGVLLLAGTGSVGYGVNRAGESVRVGGWGYLLGDEGSGYWIGAQALRCFTRHADGRESAPSRLVERIAQALDLGTPWAVIAWMYGDPTPRVRDVAALAPLVLEEAAAGDSQAAQIIETAAQDLAEMHRAIVTQLSMDSPPVAFAGGLLEKSNPLSDRLCALLNLPAHPVPKYPPAVGAALLAKLTLEV
jgi:glucosamine kinase